MKEWPHIISDEADAIYRLVSVDFCWLPCANALLLQWQSIQRIYECRTIIRKAALEALEAHWASNAKYNDPEAHKEYVEFALGPGLPFLYSHIEHQDEEDMVQVSEM